MISKKASLAIATFVLAASGAQAAFVNSEPALTTLPTESLTSPIASALEPFDAAKTASATQEVQQVAWSPFCDVIAFQGAEGGMQGYGWTQYGCN